MAAAGETLRESSSWTALLSVRTSISSVAYPEEWGADNESRQRPRRPRYLDENSVQVRRQFVPLEPV